MSNKLGHIPFLALPVCPKQDPIVLNRITLTVFLKIVVRYVISNVTHKNTAVKRKALILNFSSMSWIILLTFNKNVVITNLMTKLYENFVSKHTILPIFKICDDNSRFAFRFILKFSSVLVLGIVKSYRNE